MGDYISRDQAYKAIMGQPPDAHYPDWYGTIIKNLPAADVKPVVRGKWKGGNRGYSWHGECPECKEVFNLQVWYADVMNFCPNCGADMREGNNETD